MNTIFICYDKKQHNYFKRQGEKDIIYGLHPKTHNPFWIYKRTEKLNELIAKWLSR